MRQFSGWDEDTLKQKQQAGKIKGYVVHESNGNTVKLPNIQHSKEKEWLDWNLMFWANEHAVTLDTEYYFHSERKFRFDYAITSLKIAVEYEGIFKKDKGKTGHTSITGVMRDVDKYNEAQMLGWIVIRVTAVNYKNVLQQLNALYKKLKTRTCER